MERTTAQATSSVLDQLAKDRTDFATTSGSLEKALAKQIREAREEILRATGRLIEEAMLKEKLAKQQEKRVGGVQEREERRKQNESERRIVNAVISSMEAKGFGKK